ncbi:hypothetical protein ACHWQZ_G016267 [Mnemiopsis leidyi]
MMPALQNDHVNDLDSIIEGEFNMLNVSQVLSASDSVLREMQRELNLDHVDRVKLCHLSKRTVPKEKLADWLETVCYIMDEFSVPLLKNAIRSVESLTKRIDELQREKIDDQRKIIQLKDEVLDKRSNELNDVKSTVQTEIKSFSSIVKKNCPATLSRKKIEAAVKSVCEKEDRSKNIIIYGIEETSGEVLTDEVSKVLEEIGEKPVVTDCVRVGVKNSTDDRPRPIKFSLRNSDHVAQVLRSAKRLHTKEGYKSVYICPDRTVQERKAFKILVDQLKEKRKLEPNGTYYIRNNRILSSGDNIHSSG